MKAFFAAIKRSPKLSVLVAAVVAAVVVPAALLAWGPDRTTYTMADAAPHVTFNSITDNPNHGDERNFVLMREAGVGDYNDDVQLQAGKEYEVYVFFHNNAKPTLNDAAHNYAGIAQNAQMRVQMPASVKAGDKARVTGFVSADNAQPQQVWDEAYGHANQNLTLRYVPGSAKIHSLGAINGQTMPDTLYTTGAKLGFDALDGKLPGCTHYEGYVIFRFAAVAPNFEVQKKVTKLDSNKFEENVNVKPGETVEYSIEYKNTGSTDQNDVVVKDQLPEGMTYVPNSTSLANIGTGGKWVKLSTDDIVTETGINIGDYGPDTNAFVAFRAKVADASKLKCGVNKLVNNATVETNNGSKSDTASVTVERFCKDTPEEETPTELPKTGIDGGILTVLGVSTLVGGAAYAIRGRNSILG